MCMCAWGHGCMGAWVKVNGGMDAWHIWAGAQGQGGTDAWHMGSWAHGGIRVAWVHGCMMAGGGLGGIRAAWAHGSVHDATMGIDCAAVHLT